LSGLFSRLEQTLVLNRKKGSMRLPLKAVGGQMYVCTHFNRLQPDLDRPPDSPFIFTAWAVQVIGLVLTIAFTYTSFSPQLIFHADDVSFYPKGALNIRPLR
jgi:hypothetical protein